MVLARQIEVERCLETSRNRAAILRGLERKQISKVQLASGEIERSGIFFFSNKSSWFLSYLTDRKQEEYICILKAKESLQCSGKLFNECNNTWPKAKPLHFYSSSFPCAASQICRIWECEKQNNTRTTLAALGCLFNQGISPVPQAVCSCQMWYCLGAQCEMKSGKSDVGCRKHHSKNCCSQEFHLLLKCLSALTVQYFRKWASKKICLSTFKRCYEDSRNHEVLFIFCHYNSTTLIPEDSAAKNRSVKEEITEIQKKMKGEKKGEKPLKPSSNSFFQLSHVLNLFPQILSSPGSLPGNWLGL